MRKRNSISNETQYRKTWIIVDFTTNSNVSLHFSICLRSFCCFYHVDSDLTQKTRQLKIQIFIDNFADFYQTRFYNDCAFNDENEEQVMIDVRTSNIDQYMNALLKKGNLNWKKIRNKTNDYAKKTNKQLQ